MFLFNADLLFKLDYKNSEKSWTRPNQHFLRMRCCMCWLCIQYVWSQKLGCAGKFRYVVFEYGFPDKTLKVNRTSQFMNNTN